MPSLFDVILTYDVINIKMYTTENHNSNAQDAFNSQKSVGKTAALPTQATDVV